MQPVWQPAHGLVIGQRGCEDTPTNTQLIYSGSPGWRAPQVTCLSWSSVQLTDGGSGGVSYPLQQQENGHKSDQSGGQYFTARRWECREIWWVCALQKSNIMPWDFNSVTISLLNLLIIYLHSCFNKCISDKLTESVLPSFLFSALIVRFLTRRFIGEYGSIGKKRKTPRDPSDPYTYKNKRSGFWHAACIKTCFLLSESIYSHHDKIDGRDICFNIWDSLCPQVRKLILVCVCVWFQLTRVNL